MSEDFHAKNGLEQLFNTFKGNAFVFVEPGGNFGDHLIYWGAEVLATRLGLSFKVVTLNRFLKYQIGDAEVVYIHGGGGYNRWCSGSVIKALEHALSSSAAAVIQGPCTLEEDREYLLEVMVPVLARYQKNLYFMTRETISYRLALNVLQPFCMKVMLDHDTALQLTKEDVVKRVGAVTPKYQLYGFRLDNESGEAHFAVDRLGVRMDPAYFCRSFDHWIRVHAGAEKIITNRTHSSILGAILGTDTTLFPSRYHKNRSVWEFSLELRGVHWSDGVAKESGMVRNDILDFLPSFFRKSYKVERMVRFGQGVPLK